MRTTLILPDELLERVQRLSGEQSKTGAIVAAMESFVKAKGNEQLRALRGKVSIDYDWQAAEAEEVRLQTKREARLGAAR
jgi:metal-responsive CopG/Arc/MetJ family transcriptional regulator